MNEKVTDPIFLKPYNPSEVEESLYREWETSSFFNPDTCKERGVADPEAQPFSIVLPPPNVTGTLHMGHAAMLATEDILVRHARMTGKPTLWLPGTDSAAIATQSKVEKEIQKKEGKSRYDLGRDELLRRVGEFAEESKATIIAQTKKMGSSLDWSRYAYTMDETRYKAVMTAFVRMYEAGLIYRGHRIVNWDPKGQTTISDDEIVYVEEKTTFYHFQYGPFVIGTARPETKFGDKYVVMHPDDERYKDYSHGQTIEVEWINGIITATIIKDASIDMAFGTGVMTITPWHSVVDFEIAERHHLDKEQIIDERGKLLPIAGECAGMKITEARARVVELLRAKGLIVKEEAYTHNIATAERTGATIEPQIKEQWFIDVDKEFTIPKSSIVGIPSGSQTTLKALMKQCVESKEIHILPDRFEKVYFNWIDNLRPWCISRQIWFGHRIPVWYKGEEMFVGVTAPTGEGWEQDPDTLDTWFSSGLWTFSTLGWPDNTPDLTTYHPTTVLETGYDILFFWVARMVLMSTFHLGEVPFKTVYLHGLVRDAKGQKMSKSLGNIIDPVELIEKYGADAVRLSLIIGAAAGNDTKLSEDKVRGYKYFANKLWNVARFIFENTQDTDITDGATLSTQDAQYLHTFTELSKEIDSDIQNFRLYLAAEKLYHYAWDTLAAHILEESKKLFAEGNEVLITSRKQLLLIILRDLLKLLHPFAPFVTEKIWQHSPFRQQSRPFIMIETWPVHNK